MTAPYVVQCIPSAEQRYYVARIPDGKPMTPLSDEATAEQQCRDLTELWRRYAWNQGA